MAESFHDVQRVERRRSWLLLALLSLLYFGLITTIAIGYRSLERGLQGMRIERPEFRAENAASWEPEPLLTPSLLLAAWGIGCMLVLIQVWFARNHAVESITRALRAGPPDDTDRYHRRFHNTVGEMAVASGLAGRVRAVVAPSGCLSAFAAEDRRSGAIIGVTEGLLSRLSRAQMQAAVAHEMAHVREGDARLAAVMCAMLAPFMKIAEEIKGAGDDASNSQNRDNYVPFAFVFTHVFTLVVMFLYFCMRLISTVFSRKREILADASAVQFTRNPLALAQALHRIATHHHFMGEAAGAFAPIFVMDPTSSTLSEENSFLSNLFASHPPVSKRLDLLLAMARVGPEALEDDASPALDGSDLYDDKNPDDDSPWLLRLDEGWSAPMSLAALLAHPAFGPSAWVTRPGSFSPLKAARNPILAAALGCAVAAETESLGTDGVAGPGHLCPRCRIPLRAEHYEGAAVEKCPECGGLLVDEERSRRILSRREKAFDESFRQKVRDWWEENKFRKEDDPGKNPNGSRREPIICPQCGGTMTPRFYSYQYHIEIDRCFSCRRIWFDREEMETLQVLVEEFSA